MRIVLLRTHQHIVRAARQAGTLTAVEHEVYLHFALIEDDVRA